MSPTPIAVIIAEYSAELKLLDWIQPGPILRSAGLYANPLAYKAGLLDIDHIDPKSATYGDTSMCKQSRHKSDSSCYCKSKISANLAFDNFILNKHCEGFYHTYGGFARMCIYAWSVRHIGIPDIDQAYDYKEFNDRANEERNSEYSSMNPMEIKFICANTNMMDFSALCANPAAIDIIKSLKHINCDYLSLNPNPRDLEYLRDHWDEIDIKEFAGNPSIFHYKTDKKLVKLLSR